MLDDGVEGDTRSSEPSDNQQSPASVLRLQHGTEPPLAIIVLFATWSHSADGVVMPRSEARPLRMRMPAHVDEQERGDYHYFHMYLRF